MMRSMIVFALLLTSALVHADPSIPPRPAGAITGSAFLEKTKYLTRAKREEEILKEVSSGNIPDFERTLVEVTATITGADGVVHTAIYRALPDYVAIGSNTNFVRIPMGSRTAQKIADLFGCSLPTRKMVDQIWAKATVKLAPAPLPASSIMMTNYYFGLHQTKVEAQRKGKPLGALTAGHKKDVVISNKLLAKPLSVAIYGWHYLSGKPIQPLSTVHEYSYADYSHGIRLIDATVTVDGAPMPITALLKSATLHSLLSDEGVMPSPRVPGVPLP